MKGTADFFTDYKNLPAIWGEFEVRIFHIFWPIQAMLDDPEVVVDPPEISKYDLYSLKDCKLWSGWFAHDKMIPLDLDLGMDDIRFGWLWV